MQLLRPRANLLHRLRTNLTTERNGAEVVAGQGYSISLGNDDVPAIRYTPECRGIGIEIEVGEMRTGLANRRKCLLACGICRVIVTIEFDSPRFTQFRYFIDLSA